MEAPHLERKLVAILAADIEGFGTHMERDEAGTLAVLSSHRLIIDASIAEFGGRSRRPQAACRSQCGGDGGG
jgi:adenylate cyclase